ncbi:hypothetical protein F503_00996 [Ophiostoma piceae UAMH 11346]|uniref:Uncharacterized protein n=1 Tax=Ophiostoma piceae (strain UAMH 11346) TaxID=1262450 RepID=S3CNW6_OPHP1|nr:hypothetical protein F503_00996 [Ophiostoma piceae UAMH 11346]
MSTDIEAIVQAMRSDLGLGRVDDLDLENGQRGQGQRPGRNGMPSGRPPSVANPRNPIPLANRWKVAAAIQKGEFDDDDAEMVKGLDRIGGGRLHALSSAPSFPPPVRRPPAYGGPNQQRNYNPPRVSTPGSQEARGPAASVHGMSRGMAVTQRPTRRSGPPVQLAAPNISPGVIRPPRQPQPMAPATPVQQTAQQPRIPDPEPEKYFHRAEIEVGDRQAKGKGVIFLVENPATEADMLYVYLEGAVYLEYPLMSMFNYLTTATQLCLQFKEEDSISVTTTALVFGPQDKMVAFMQAVKTLNQKKRQTMASSAPNGASATAAVTESSSGPDFAVEAPAKDCSSQLASPDPASLITPKLALSEEDLVLAGSHSAASDTDVLEPESSPVPMTSDLVDLSQSADENVPNQHARSNRLSTYAMDLESLCSSPAQPASESSTPGKDTSSSSTPGKDTHGFRFVPFKLPSAAKSQIERISVPGLNTPIKPQTSETAPNRAESPQEMLQSYVRTILPVFEAMDELLSIFDADDHQEIMSTVVSRVQASEERANDGKHLLSASILLKTLVSEQQAAMLSNDNTLTSSIPAPRYTPDDILNLRQQATTPPQLPSRLNTIFVPTKKNRPAETSMSSAQGDGQVTPISTQNERRGSLLKPQAESFKPSPNRQAQGQRGVWGTERSSVTLTSAPKVPTVEAKSTGLGTKGLKGSRWATADPKASDGSIFNFTGTDSHGTGGQFTFTGMGALH